MFLCLKWLQVAHEYGVRDVSARGDIVSKDGTDRVRTFDSSCVPLGQTASFITKAACPSCLVLTFRKRVYQLLFILRVVDVVALGSGEFFNSDRSG